MIGGSVANITNWPFLAVVSFGPLAHCTGSLIDPYWVLTAAHCVTLETIRKFALLNLTLGVAFSIGEQKLKLNTDLVQPEFHKHITETRFVYTIENPIPVERVVSHENFFQKDGPLDIGVHDIALLRLYKPAPLSNKIKVININKKTPANGTKCMTAGWGEKVINLNNIYKVVEFQNSSSKNFLSEIKISILSKEEFGRLIEIMMKFKELYYLFPSLLKKDKHMLTWNKIAAGTAQMDRSVTRGDSGGPLACNGALYGITHTLMAIANLHCKGILRFYSVFTQVDSYTDWIENKINNYDQHENIGVNVMAGMRKIHGFNDEDYDEFRSVSHKKNFNFVLYSIIFVIEIKLY